MSLAETPDSELTPKQELFCQFYSQLSDTYGNGTWSYALAYNHDLDNAERYDFQKNDEGLDIPYSSSFHKMENMCAVGATRLLRKDKIINRVRELKSQWFDDDRVIDSRVMDIIMKGKDTDAIAAIKHRNDIKQRVSKRLELEVSDKRKDILERFGLHAGEAEETEEGTSS